MSVPTRVVVFCGALVAALPAWRPARASTRECPVVLRPADAEQSWQDAVRDLRSWLSSPAKADFDCGAIEVHAEGARASIVFTTADGRHAERPVPSPASLVATVAALAVTIPELRSEPDQSLLPSPRPVRAAAPRSGQGEGAPSEAASARILFGGSGGMRLLSPTPCSQSSPQTCTFGSVSLAVGVGVNVRDWEFGVLAEYDPTQIALSGPAPTGLSMSTYALDLRAGVREGMGPLYGVAGAAAMITLTTETIDAASGMQGGQPDRAEPRIGIFAGVVVPRRSRFRMRPELAFDVTATHIGKSAASSDPALPPLPWWSTSASVGIEWEAP